MAQFGQELSWAVAAEHVVAHRDAYDGRRGDIVALSPGMTPRAMRSCMMGSTRFICSGITCSGSMSASEPSE